MRYRKEMKLKDGTECILRNPTAADAEAILEHMKVTSDETEFMARYSDEINMLPVEEAVYLKKLEADPKSIMIAAEVDGKIIGNAGIVCIPHHDRYRHRGTFGISIRKEYWGMGLGSAVLQAILGEARKAGLEQVELDVVDKNERAFHLYQKFGFQIYGVLPRAFLYRDGHAADAYLMVCRLEQFEG